VKKENLVHLLVIDDSANDAEASIGILRKAGIAIRANRIEDPDDLQAQLEQRAWDIILAKPKIKELSAAQALDIVKKAGKDIPFIILGDHRDESFVVDSMRAGACDVLPREQTARLQLVVARELGNLAERRTRRVCELGFRESEKRCRSLIDSSRDAITYIHEGMHIYANPVYLNMFGYHDMEDVEGMPIMDMVASQDHGRFKDYLRSYNKGEDLPNDIDVTGLRTDGTEFKAIMEFTPATIDGEACTQIIIRDQSTDQELEKKLKYLSKQDLLTGLYNRQYFMEELELAVSKAISGSGSGALLFILLDNYKSIKEDWGIAAADLVLGDVANLLRDIVTESDLLARFEGGVFTILIQDQALEAVQARAEAIRKAVEDNISEVGDKSVTTTCSIGLSLISETAPSAQEILSRADLACTVAIEHGGNRMHLHHPVADEQAGKERDQQWAERVQRALQDDHFHLVYQPIVSLHGDQGEFYEVLLRMLDEKGEEISPGQFLAAAEASGQMADIDRWVIKRAMDVLAEQRQSGRQLSFFIKISGHSLKDKTLLPWLSECLKSTRLQGNTLVFELAETSAVEHIKETKAFGKGLKELHCRFALEHFGSGLNSFNILKHLDVDFLKIDGSFIHNLSSNRENQAMVKSITEMAHSMGKLTIAEFVQDANSLAILWQCGVNYIQGYYLQEPDAALNYDFSGAET